MKQTVFKDDEEEYRMKMVPQQLDETKAALRDVEIRLEKGFYKVNFIKDSYIFIVSN
jgi:hypothetical protein